NTASACQHAVTHAEIPIKGGQGRLYLHQTPVQCVAVEVLRDAPETAGIGEGQFALLSLAILGQGGAPQQALPESLLLPCQLEGASSGLGSGRLVGSMQPADRLASLAGQRVEFLSHLREPAATGQPALAHDAG